MRDNDSFIQDIILIIPWNELRKVISLRNYEFGQIWFLYMKEIMDMSKSFIGQLFKLIIIEIREHWVKNFSISIY